jgi:hypothetical protein
MYLLAACSVKLAALFLRQGAFVISEGDISYKDLL